MFHTKVGVYVSLVYRFSPFSHSFCLFALFYVSPPSEFSLLGFKLTIIKNYDVLTNVSVLAVGKILYF